MCSGEHPRSALLSERLAAIVFLCMLSLIGSVRAQNCGDWLPNAGAAGPNGPVYSAVVTPSGDLIVGGDFTVVDNIVVNKIARFNPTTSEWSALGNGVTGWSVQSIVLLPNGDIIAGGFNWGVQRKGLARYSQATGAWTSLTTTAIGDFIYSLAMLHDGRIVVGGEFSNIGGINATNVAVYDPTSGAWSTFGNGVAGVVFDVEVLQTGEVVASIGMEIGLTGIYYNSVVRRDAVSGEWVQLGSGNGVSLIYDLLVLPDGQLIAAGSFSSIGGVSVRRLARYDESANTWLAMGGSGSGTIYSAKLSRSGDLLLAGGIELPGTSVRELAFRVDMDSGIWHPMGAVGYSEESAWMIIELPDGDILLGGRFNSVPMRYLSRYSTNEQLPMLTSLIEPATICPGEPAAFEIEVSSASSLTYQWQIRHSAFPDGEWHTLSEASQLVPCENGSAVASVSPSGANEVALIISGCETGDSGIWAVRCLVENECGGVVSEATLTIRSPDSCEPCASCAADYDLDGGVTGGDLAAFFSDYEAGAACADVDQDGGVTGSDLAFFFGVYEVGGC